MIPLYDLPIFLRPNKIIQNQPFWTKNEKKMLKVEWDLWVFSCSGQPGGFNRKKISNIKLAVIFWINQICVTFPVEVSSNFFLIQQLNYQIYGGWTINQNSQIKLSGGKCTFIEIWVFFALLSQNSGVLHLFSNSCKMWPKQPFHKRA